MTKKRSHIWIPALGLRGTLLCQRCGVELETKTPCPTNYARWSRSYRIYRRFPNGRRYFDEPECSR